MPKKESPPATAADILKLKSELKSDIKRLDQKIDSSTARLDQKIESGIGLLDQKIDSSTARLDQKIDDGFKRLASETIKTNVRIDKLEESISKNTNRILTALDQYTKTAEANNRAVAIHGQTLTEVQATLKDHKGRIEVLESAPR